MEIREYMTRKPNGSIEVDLQKMMDGGASLEAAQNVPMPEDVLDILERYIPQMPLKVQILLQQALVIYREQKWTEITEEFVYDIRHLPFNEFLLEILHSCMRLREIYDSSKAIAVTLSQFFMSCGVDSDLLYHLELYANGVSETKTYTLTLRAAARYE